MIISFEVAFDHYGITRFLQSSMFRIHIYFVPSHISKYIRLQEKLVECMTVYTHRFVAFLIS